MKVCFILAGLFASIVLASGQECSSNDGDFRCANGRCIRAVWICDNENDCGDNTDEIDPETGKCPLCPTEANFQCANGRCTKLSYACDGINDCRDWSDEKDCTRSDGLKMKRHEKYQ